VGDDHQDAVVLGCLETLLDIRLQGGVEVARRLIEHEHVRILQECSGERDPPALAAGESDPVITERRVQPPGGSSRSSVTCATRQAQRISRSVASRLLTVRLYRTVSLKMNGSCLTIETRSRHAPRSNWSIGVPFAVTTPSSRLYSRVSNKTTVDFPT
jgi:hypothetical protein